MRCACGGGVDARAPNHSRRSKSNRIRFGTDVVGTEQEFSAFEFGGGLVAQLSEHVSVHVVADYTVDLGDEDRETIEGNLGLRVRW